MLSLGWGYYINALLEMFSRNIMEFHVLSLAETQARSA